MTNRPTRAVYYYFRRWHKRGRGEQINQLLRGQIRMKQGRYPQATAAIVDSQKGLNDRKKGEVSGFDGGKLVKGRKRHIERRYTRTTDGCSSYLS